jgi:LemA protein
MIPLIIAVAVVALLVVMLITMYNRLVGLRLRAQNSWSDIDVQLKRRADIVPNLVATVKGYASHERETLEAVTRARAGAIAAQGADPATRAQAEAGLSTALRGLSVAVEAYPELQASGGFRDLQAQLAGIEDAIQNARRYYNAVVRDLNTAIMTFPSNLLAGPMGFQPREFFQAESADRAVPSVSF